MIIGIDDLFNEANKDKECNESQSLEHQYIQISEQYQKLAFCDADKQLELLRKATSLEQLLDISLQD